MRSIYYYFLAISFTLQISRTAPPKQHVFFEIDEFINQLMTSEKFDELADVIADKAVKKIRNMDSQNNSNVGKDALRNLVSKENDPKYVEKTNFEQEQLNDHDKRSDGNINNVHGKKKVTASRIDDKSNHNRDRNMENEKMKSDNEKIDYDRENNKGKDSREKSGYSHETQKHKYGNDNNEKNKGKDSWEKSGYSHETQKHKYESDEKQTHDNKNLQKNSESISKIDTQAFLQKHMASKELELNFKHLKGELERHRFDVKENNIKSNKGYDKIKRNKHNENNRAADKNEDDKTEKTPFKNKLKNIDSKELLLSQGSNENKAHEQATFHDAENNIRHGKKSEENKLLNDSDAGNEEKRNIIFKYDRNSIENPIPRIKKQKNYEEDQNSENDIIANAKAFIDKVMDKVSDEFNDPESYSSKEILEVGANPAHNAELDERTSIYSGKPRRSNVSASKTKDRIDEAGEKLSNLQTSAEYADYDDNSAIRPQPKFINTYK